MQRSSKDNNRRTLSMLESIIRRILENLEHFFFELSKHKIVKKKKFQGFQKQQ